jgi:hypothetical protein
VECATSDVLRFSILNNNNYKRHVSTQNFMLKMEMNRSLPPTKRRPQTHPTPPQTARRWATSSCPAPALPTMEPSPARTASSSSTAGRRPAATSRSRCRSSSRCAAPRPRRSRWVHAHASVRRMGRMSVHGAHACDRRMCCRCAAPRPRRSGWVHVRASMRCMGCMGCMGRTHAVIECAAAAQRIGRATIKVGAQHHATIECGPAQSAGVPPPHARARHARVHAGPRVEHLGA